MGICITHWGKVLILANMGKKEGKKKGSSQKVHSSICTYLSAFQNPSTETSQNFMSSSRNTQNSQAKPLKMNYHINHTLIVINTSTMNELKVKESHF